MLRQKSNNNGANDNVQGLNGNNTMQNNNSNSNTSSNMLQPVHKAQQLGFVGNSVAMLIQANELDAESGGGGNKNGNGGGEEDGTFGLIDSFAGFKVAFGSFLVNVAVLGLLYSFGIFVLPMTQEFGVGRGEVSLISTIGLGIFFLVGMISGPLSDRYGVKRCIAFGGVVWVLGCILGSFSTSLTMSIFTQGLFCGIGTSFVYWPGYVCVCVCMHA